MPDGGEAGADAERLRASERAVVALAIANWTVWTDAANGSPADRASADVSAVSHALGSGVGRQINVTFTLDGGADADVAAILETAAVPTIDAASSPFPAATAPPSREPAPWPWRRAMQRWVAFSSPASLASLPHQTFPWFLLIDRG